MWLIGVKTKILGSDLTSLGPVLDIQMCVQLHIKYGSAAFEVFWELHSLKVMHFHFSDTVSSRKIIVLRVGSKKVGETL